MAFNFGGQAELPDWHVLNLSDAAFRTECRHECSRVERQDSNFDNSFYARFFSISSTSRVTDFQTAEMLLRAVAVFEQLRVHRVS